MPSIKTARAKSDHHTPYKINRIKGKITKVIDSHGNCYEPKELTDVCQVRHINDGNLIYFRIIMEFLNYPDSVNFGHTCRSAHSLLQNTMMYDNIRSIIHMPKKMDYIEYLIYGEDMETIGALVHTSKNFIYHLQSLVTLLYKITSYDDYRRTSLKVLIGCGLVTLNREDIPDITHEILHDKDTLEDYNRIIYGEGIKTEFMHYRVHDY